MESQDKRIDFGEENKLSWVSWIWETDYLGAIKGFNKGYDDIQELSATMMMIVIALLMGFGMPALLTMIVYVDHERVMASVDFFLGEEILWMGAAWILFALTLIPIASVFDDYRNNRLKFVHENEYAYSGLSLVKIVRSLRYFLGLWSGWTWTWGDSKTVIWESLGVEKTLVKRTSWLKRLEYFLIVTVVLVVFTDSFLSIEGVDEILGDKVWFMGIWSVFTETEFNVFMPAMITTLYTFAGTLALTTVAREITMNVAEKRHDRKLEQLENERLTALALYEAEQKRAEEEQAIRNANVVTVKASSAYGNSWLNLQSLEGILIDEDKVDVTENEYRFYDSHLELWLPSTYNTKTKIRNAIIKQLELRKAQ